MADWNKISVPNYILESIQKTFHNGLYKSMLAYSYRCFPILQIKILREWHKIVFSVRSCDILLTFLTMTSFIIILPYHCVLFWFLATYFKISNPSFLKSEKKDVFYNNTYIKTGMSSFYSSYSRNTSNQPSFTLNNKL